VSLIVQDAALARGGFDLSVSFEAPMQGVTVVFGPSGAGKSMLLSALAGLNRLRHGRVTLGDRVLEDVAAREREPTHRRGVGLVFQDARLFPHLTVRGNIAYAERRRPAHRNAPLVDDVAARLDLVELLDRPVRNLSGGEKGRVALARALASEPELLLLDEPFAALDGKRRRAYLAMLRDLSATVGLPMMVVTHQIEDAAELADHVVALKDGRIVASGPPSQAMRDPAFLALLDGRDVGGRIEGHAIAGGPKTGGIWVRADSVLIATEAPHGLSARNVWEGRIVSIAREADGSALVCLYTRVGYIFSRITPEALADLHLAEGGTVWAVVKTHAL
jgi:molybdate transport system ATP-binding protein